VTRNPAIQVGRARQHGNAMWKASRGVVFPRQSVVWSVWSMWSVWSVWSVWSFSKYTSDGGLTIALAIWIPKWPSAPSPLIART
jgi:hypothetical protein